MQRFQRFAGAFLMGIAVAHPAISAEEWIVAKSPHFELSTRLPESAARAAVRHFEQIRRFFLAASPFPGALDAPVRIIAFDFPASAEPYRLNTASNAYFTKDDDREYIVMQDLDPASYRAAVHEYTHLVLIRSGVKLPLWMNEGWADLHSTLKPKGHKALVGDILPGRRETFLRGPLIPLEELDRTDQRSPSYNEKDRAGLFYAESWALMHMLFLSPQYSPKFNAFVESARKGAGIAESCRSAFGRTVAAVEADLAQYMRQDRLLGAVFDVDLTQHEAEPEVQLLSGKAVALLLADLLATTRKVDQARAAYQRIESQYPGLAETEEGLGKVALESGDRNEAIVHLVKALDRGSEDAAMCFTLAMLSREISGDRTVTVRALRRAILLKPDYAAARLQLGIALLDMRDYANSLTELQKIPRITADIAAWYFAAAAFDNAKLGRTEDARKDVANANRWATTDAQKEQIARIFRALGEEKKNQGPATK